MEKGISKKGVKAINYPERSFFPPTMRYSCPSIFAAMRAVVALLSFSRLPLTFAAPNPHVFNPRQDGGLEWTVIGDSWASGVAYNWDNMYDSAEICMRTTEA